MANQRRMSLIDEAVAATEGFMIVVEDCVETSGAFVVHHLLKRALNPQSSDVVVFVSFAHPFSHYDRILRRMGCNLLAQRDAKRLFFLDMLTPDRHERNQWKTSEDLLVTLYGKIQKAVEICESPEAGQRISIIIDDVSLMEVDAKGSSNLVLDFLHYCCTLRTQYGCSLIILNHHDVYATSDGPNMLLLQLEHMADILIKVQPLATGLAADVHGQLTVLNKGRGGLLDLSKNKVSNFQFRIKDNTVEYFYPGNSS